ncbi:amidohydrolase family protein [Nocardioides hwasunensis]|uniref:Amidohydrolase n=1 Tax=Nocardioides hwasunensis TaxID=397258 RepID=A0ABR8MI04_9ACTN|nr:amidohydrolase family protein [Nocardioides hwasunensis]MBD3915558.1 amidohydrolase [Nocardioides hwasunensis]
MAPHPYDVFAGVEDLVPAGVADHLRAVDLVDHHVHGHYNAALDRREFEDALNEGSTNPVPPHISMFESPLGVSIRRWCAPMLGLEPLASAEAYWEARSSFDAWSLARTLVGSAGVDTWVVDTGFVGDVLATPQQLAAAGGGRSVEIVRLETLLEGLVTRGVGADELAEAFRAELRGLPAEVVGAKTVAAYRCGLDIDWSRPTDDDVRASAARLHDEGGKPRLTDPVLIAFAVHEALACELPLQVHIGFGDRDLELDRADPLHLVPLLRDAPGHVPVMLLHCYPYHRQAGYLAQAFDQVHFDVGLAVNFLGAASSRLIAEAMELAPFAKQLYSSDAFGLPELHVLGSILWRRGMGLTLGEWVRRGDWAESDARDAVDLIARSNAERVYRLT